MNTTSMSLLESLRAPGDDMAWDRFVKLYSPLLLEWTRRLRLQASDAADLVQDVLVILVRKLPDFRYQSGGSFRGWLKTIALNAWRDRLRKWKPESASPAQLAEVAQSEEIFSQEVYRRFLLRQAMESIAPEFQEHCWRAFLEHGLGGKPADAVGRNLGMTTGAVYAAKFRVLERLRRELRGLLT